MRILCCIFCFLSGFASFAQAPRQLPQPILPANAPEAVPRLHPFPLAHATTPTAAVVVCPGGGYGNLAMEKEGFAVVDWLNSIGVAAFVLEYRHNGNGPNHQHPAPFEDAQWALRTVRADAAQLNIAPDRIGILGFSAGGHLAATASNGSSETANFAILIYPVISMREDLAHKGSRRNLLGENPDATLIEKLSMHLQVTAKTPPTFIVSGGEDRSVKPENSLLYYQALRAHGVPAELHIFESGGHGFGLAKNFDEPFNQWPALCAEWLRDRGLAPTPAIP